MDLLLSLIIHQIVYGLKVENLHHCYDWNIWSSSSICIIMIQILEKWIKRTSVNGILHECKWSIYEILSVFLPKSCVEEITHTVTCVFHE